MLKEKSRELKTELMPKGRLDQEEPGGRGRGGNSVAGKSDLGWDWEPKEERASDRGQHPQYLAP